MKNMKILFLLVIALSILGLAGCSEGKKDEKPTIVLGDAGWDSFTFHNEVAKLIIENGYGYKTTVTMGSTPTTFTGLENGDIDVYMEAWTNNIPTYDEVIKRGNVLEVGLNYNDNAQGLYVPTYIIKGDPKRGIKPMAPDLKSIKDLSKYWKVFKDEENPNLGRIYGAIPGWEVDKILQIKLQNDGLDKNYNYFSPGSDAALASSIAAAYEKGEPWLGYYWEPTWIMGKYDMTLLEDEPYSDKLWKDKYSCQFPAVDVRILVHKDMKEKAPDVVEFLKKYKTSSKLTSEALAYMQKNDVEAKDAAKWFLKEHEEIWAQWVSKEVAEKVKGVL